VASDGYDGVPENTWEGEELLENSDGGEGPWKHCSPRKAAQRLDGGTAGSSNRQEVHDRLGCMSFA
jgi:hypothetical protein